jgi:hypothetical protein
MDNNDWIVGFDTMQKFYDMEDVLMAKGGRYDVELETVFKPYVTGENEEDAYDNALAGKIWDYANDGDEIEWYNFTYKQETIEDTGEVTGE